MSYLDLNAKIDITCPDCSHVFKVKLKNLKDGANIQCTDCNETITIKDEGFSEGLKKTEKAISKLAKKLK